MGWSNVCSMVANAMADLFSCINEGPKEPITPGYASAQNGSNSATKVF